jgi:carbon storage regulator
MLCVLPGAFWAEVRNDDRKELTMLVLSRQRDESIVIGDNVVITIVDIRGDKVRLGIEAPGEIPVHRQEVYEAIQRENRKLVPPQSGMEASKVLGGDAGR